MSAAALQPIPGVKVATAAIGDAYGGRPNLLLAAFEPGTRVAGVLTRSTTAAAPVRWTRARLAEGAAPRALVVNAGNANCFTGAAGEEAVRRTAALAAEIVGCRPEETYLASTGRIGQPLDMTAYEAALARAGAALAEHGWDGVAEAIMTTDRFPKAGRRDFPIGEAGLALQGATKGNTMIAPHLATTLSFLFTDAGLPSDAMQPLLARAAERSYNRISVDNTQSTNDTLLLFATGAGARHAAPAGPDDPALAGFAEALDGLLAELAGRIVADAASEAVALRIAVRGAASERAAARMARAVADSYLVRRDVASRRELMPGRILAAIGMAEEAVELARLTVALGGEIVVAGGGVRGPATIDPSSFIRDGRIEIAIDAGVGDGRATVHAVAL